MDYIINRINEILDENSISVYYLAKLTGISNSTLHKILHFERTMKPKHFYVIIENLPLSIAMKRELTDRFQQATMGTESYTAYKDIYDMLKNFSNDSFAPFKNRLSPSGMNPSFKGETVSIYRGKKIGSVINFSLIEEMNTSRPQAYVYVPAGSDNILSYIDNTISLYDTDIHITFLIDFVSTSSALSTNYNIKVLKNIIPVILQPLENYSFYYTYVKAAINESYTSPYPYFIALSNKVILINTAFDEIVVINDSSLAANYSSLCKAKLSKYKNLIEKPSDICSIITSIVNGQAHVNTHYCIEYEPCFAFYFTREMIAPMIPENAPGRDMLIAELNKRYDQLQSMKNSIQIFNKDSLMLFARTGIIREFPDEFSHPCSPRERLYFLNSILKAINSENHIIRALNPINFEISDCLSLIVQDNQYLQFSIFNDRKSTLKYYKIDEISICTCFSNFIKHIVQTNIVCSKKETESFIKEAIAYTQSLIG